MSKMDKQNIGGKRILRSSVKAPKTPGTEAKRLKTSDRRLQTLKESFNKLKNCEPPKYVEAKGYIDDVMAQLEEKHYVVVTGSNDNYLTEIAVHAIKGRGYHDDKCVEMLRPSDWEIIDPDIVDIVLCKEPLKNIVNKRSKLQQMNDIFNDYSKLVSEEEAKSDKKLDMVIIINSTILEDFQKKMNSRLFEEVTNVSNPAKGNKDPKVKGAKPTVHKSDSSPWSVNAKKEFNVILPNDTSVCYITGCHMLPSGEIILSDFYNKRLKKLDESFGVISTCDLPHVAVGMCYIGDNIVAVSLGEKLQLADVAEDVKLTTSVDLDEYCKGLTSHESKIYIVEENSVCIHSKSGTFERKLYTNPSKDAYFQDIAVSDDGQRIYIASWFLGLITIDSSGNHLHTFYEDNLKVPFGLCVDHKSNVLMCLTSLDCVVQFSKDGRQKLGQTIEKADSVPSPRSLFFDRKTMTLIVGCSGWNKVFVLDLI